MEALEQKSGSESSKHVRSSEKPNVLNHIMFLKTLMLIGKVNVNNEESIFHAGRLCGVHLVWLSLTNVIFGCHFMQKEIKFMKQTTLEETISRCESNASVSEGHTPCFLEDFLRSAL